MINCPRHLPQASELTLSVERCRSSASQLQEAIRGQWEGFALKALQPWSLMLCVRNLSGRELLAAAPRASSSSYPPFWANHAFDSGSSCGDTVLDENATLKLPLELVATVCGYVEADAGVVAGC